MKCMAKKDKNQFLIGVLWSKEKENYFLNYFNFRYMVFMIKNIFLFCGFWK